MLWQDILILVGKLLAKVTITKAAYPIKTNANLFFDKMKKGTSANLQPSLHFNGMIFWWKKGSLHKNGMAAMPKSFAWNRTGHQTQMTLITKYSNHLNTITKYNISVNFWVTFSNAKNCMISLTIQNLD